ncbi:type VII secretion protein EccCa [Corynebacterium sp.]|uniref:type VII secretion protein EccCa n=1 Tax=Corynebacterium sp. TaxID=1720 RepID=UPI0026DB355B|nr:type VII secretion protein EccCa [Corynebacterium sp.]MDO5031274.1 type VII secretion protein EccCa [Corynebacterium sp.]
MPIFMVAAMLGMVALMVLGAGDARRVSPMSLMFPLMMLASVFMMFNPASGGEDPDETRRTYLRHLAALRATALSNADKQRAHEEHRNPAPRELAALVGTHRLWERPGDAADALEVRVGTGPVSLCTPVNVPDSGAAEDLDPVCAVSVRHTVRAVGSVQDMPVVIQLQAFRVLGLAGEDAWGVARAMVLHLAVLHGPETVGIEFHHGATDGRAQQEWQWLKWLPHARDPATARYRIAVVAEGPGLPAESAALVDDPTITTIIAVGVSPYSQLGRQAEDEGIYLHADEQLRVVTAAGEEEIGACDVVDYADAVLRARSLAPFRRPERGEGGNAPRRGRGGDLIDLVGYGDVDELIAAGMWQGRSPADRLRVPIGVDESGQPLLLDLKESAQGGMGPHGLCIGATGSGKSELLRTLVVALAATHSPDELNMVLVDFKGGATFLGCDDLPHTSAVITNLEEESTLVERMYDAISGEMNRRQELLRAAGNFANVDQFNASADAVAAHGPLPALVIVVDEFSELLGQHPDFAELFVAVGRLGRSLHVHLLLASQRLEEGRLRGLDSHLSYRIGLKTFSAAESRQVLGVTDAYHLPAQPGAGYLKTDADAPVRFQAAYVSGPLRRRIPLQPDAVSQAPRVQLFSGWGREEQEAQYTTVIDESTTLLAAVVAAAAREAARRGQEARRIWLPPLPDVVELSAVCEPDSPALCAAVGLIDRPYQQRQDPFSVDFSTDGGHLAICGGPQSGKSMALRSVVASMSACHEPQQVRFYVIDLGGGTLGLLGRLPHVAAVAGREEPEKIRRIVDEVAGFVRRPAPPHTFLVIDGWHHIGTSGADYEDLAEPITHLVADGASARIHVIIATSRWTSMRPSIRDLISARVELRLGEAMDSLIDRKAQQKLPAKPGRGLNLAGENLLWASTSPQDLAHICRLHEGAEPAPRLKMLPAVLRELPQAAGGATLPRPAGEIAWGIGGPDLDVMVWQHEAHQHAVCVGSQGSGKSTFLAVLMAEITRLPREEARLVVIDERRAHLGTLPEEMVAVYAASASAATSAILDTVRTLEQRLPGPEVTPAQLATRSWWEGPDIYLAIDDLDLVSDIALAPLLEILPHARDVGLHLLLARKAGGIGRAMFGQFLSAVRDLQPAVLLLDAERDEGPIFGIKPTALPPGRGQWVVRGRNHGLAQVLCPKTESTTETTEGEDS